MVAWQDEATTQAAWLNLGCSTILLPFYLKALELGDRTHPSLPKRDRTTSSQPSKYRRKHKTDCLDLQLTSTADRQRSKYLIDQTALDTALMRVDSKAYKLFDESGSCLQAFHQSLMGGGLQSLLQHSQHLCQIAHDHCLRI